jgi:hypothetical protein
MQRASADRCGEIALLLFLRDSVELFDFLSVAVAGSLTARILG